MIPEDKKAPIRQVIISKYLILIVLACLFLLSCANEPQQQALPDSEDQYIGSVNSDKYHYPECRWAKKILPKNRVWFKDKEHAAEYGYVACKVCKPPR